MKPINYIESILLENYREFVRGAYYPEDEMITFAEYVEMEFENNPESYCYWILDDDVDDGALTKQGYSVAREILKLIIERNL